MKNWAGPFIASSALALASCASTGGNLQLATATFIGGNVAPEQVTVSDVHRSAMSVKWQAATPKGRYSCSADDMVRRPYCVKQ